MNKFSFRVKMQERSLSNMICTIIILITVINLTSSRWDKGINERPILGVATQMYNVTANETYIVASYVKFIEAGGARVIPIRIGRPNSTYPDTLNCINGVLLPGGKVSSVDSKYANVAKTVYQLAIEANDRGEYFPIWAVELGFEILANILAPNHILMTNCSVQDIAMPLNFSDGATNSRLFSDLPVDVYQALLNEPVTYSDHQRCLTPQSVSSSGLDKSIKVLSTNYDVNGLEFVSTFEVIKYPFFGLQWHPEKAPWEWTTVKQNIPHSPSASRVTQYFASFLSNEARKSAHKYDDPLREETDLIYNVKTTYSGRNGTSEFEQIYKIKTG